MKIFLFILIYFLSCDSFKVDENPSIQAITELVNNFYLESGIGMRRNHFIFHLAEEVVQQLNSGGIPSHSSSLFFDMRYPPFESYTNPGLQILKIEDLRYGFEMWLIAFGFACCVFVLEFSVEFLKKIIKWLKKNLRDLLGGFLLLKLLSEILVL